MTVAPARDDGSGDWRAFLTAFALTCGVAALLFLGGTEFIITRLGVPQDNISRHKREFFAAHEPTAAFGDSMVMHALRPEKGFQNFGFIAESLGTMLRKAELYAESGRGRRIVLQYSTRQFIAPDDPRANDMESEFFEGREMPLNLLRPQFRPFWFYFWSAALKAPSRLYGQPQAPSAPTDTFQGLSETDQRRMATSQVQLNEPVDDERVLRARIDAFVEAVKRIRATGASVCIVEYPLHSFYRTAAAANARMARLRDIFLQRMVREHVLFVDLRSILPDSLFLDPYHVGAGGAGLVTGRVLADCFEH